MDNTKRSIHNSGPLGILVKNGQVKKINDADQNVEPTKNSKVGSSYFKTQTGIEFAEHELLYVDPKECEPWQYANRLPDEMGNMDELIESIKHNRQLQPALIRKHPLSHDGIHYEIIFGRRRHLACLELGIPFLVIYKEFFSIHEAIASQDAENKFRNDVSHYSNAMLYQRLLSDGVFKTEKELAAKLRISTSSLNEVMAFAKIPPEVLCEIPSVHLLSKSFAQKIVSLVNQSELHRIKVAQLAKQFGGIISSPTKLEKTLEHELNQSKRPAINQSSQQFLSNAGQKFFTFKYDQRGNPCIVLDKKIANNLDLEQLCQSFHGLLQQLLQ